LDGFQNFVARDEIFTGEIGESAGNFQNAIMGSGGEIHLLHGMFEVTFAFGVELAVIADLARPIAELLVALLFFGDLISGFG
jgi:hypothetical protein